MRGSAIRPGPTGSTAHAISICLVPPLRSFLSFYARFAIHVMNVKTLSLLLLVCLVTTAETRAQGVTDTAQVQEPALRQELLDMERTDQQVRQALIEKQQSGTPLTPQDVGEVDSVDTAHTKRMKAIVASYGWPGERLVGRDGADAAFLLVQHADRDPDFQKACLPLLRKAYERGEASGQHVALLTDRVLVADGQPQRYGTQARIEDGTIRFHPIEDSLHVDERRADMGMPPLDVYKQEMRKMYLQQSAAGQ